jgi:release factor glutamine methyltransferase
MSRLSRVTDSPRHEAEILLAAALDKPRSWLLAHPEQPILDCDATDRYEAHVTRRSHGEPIAYILGEKEFWSLVLEVTPDVLIPRPETELAVDRALPHLPPVAPARGLYLACGRGAIGLAIAHDRPRLKVVGTDVSDAALTVARRNASRLHLANLEFRAGSWYTNVEHEHYALIVCNPPYIAAGDPRVERDVRRYEPHDALYAGSSGLDALRTVIRDAPAHLVEGGWLVVEHGDMQGPAVRGLFQDAGFDAIATHRDLADVERCTEGEWVVGCG